MTLLLLSLWLGPAFVALALWMILSTVELLEDGSMPSFGEAIGTVVGFFIPAFNFFPAWFLVAEAVSEFRSAF